MPSIGCSVRVSDMAKRILGVAGCVLAVFFFLFYAAFFFATDIDSAGVPGFILNPITIFVVLICAALIRGGIRLTRGKPLDKE